MEVNLSTAILTLQFNTFHSNCIEYQKNKNKNWIRYCVLCEVSSF